MFNVFIGLISYIITYYIFYFFPIFCQFFQFFSHFFGNPRGDLWGCGERGWEKKTPTAGIGDGGREDLGLWGRKAGRHSPPPPPPRAGDMPSTATNR